MAKRGRKGVKPDEEAAYYDEAASWDQDVYERSKVRERRWFFVSVVAMALAILQAFALVGLTPMKTLVPYVIKVDTTTGIVEEMQRLDRDGSVTENEAITKYFISRYLHAREQYDPQDYERLFRRTERYSDEAALQNYYARMDTGNEDSPLNRWGQSAQATITIKSISFIDDQTAIVNWYRTVTEEGRETVTHWASTLTYTYRQQPATEQERLKNPLGFVVTDYRRDPRQAP